MEELQQDEDSDGSEESATAVVVESAALFCFDVVNVDEESDDIDWFDSSSWSIWRGRLVEHLVLHVFDS